MTDEITNMLIKLRMARAALDEMKQNKLLAENALSLTNEYKALAITKATETALKTSVEEMERVVRETAVEYYFADASIPSAVSISQYKVVAIPDLPAAKEWALKNFTPALLLDVKAFEKAAKDGSIPSTLAVVTSEPRAKIASNLDDIEVE